MSISINISFIEKSLEKFLGEAVEVMAMMRTTKPGDGITPRLRQLLVHYNVSGWSIHYLDPANSFKAKLLTIMLPEEINALGVELTSLDHLGQQAWLDENFQEFLDEDDLDIEFLDQKTTDAMSEIEKSDLYLRARYSCHFSLVTLFNHFSYIAYKKPIYQLVQEALDGDDESFLKAIQIDKTVLAHIPYFVERNLRAAKELDFNFQRRINTYCNKPILQSRIRHHELWLVFAFLDEMNVLGEFDACKEDLLDMCQRLGIYGPKDDYADLESFNKLLREFKSNQSGIMPKYGNYQLVKDVISSG